LDEFNWIVRFLQPDLQRSNVRVAVWSYGYDSRTATNSVANVEDVANALLDRIYRETNGPVIFVAHSLGGLVVKKAIILAHTDDARYGGLLKRIRGCVFLGVPHRGADNTWWKTIPGSLVRASTMGSMGNNNFADSLGRESDTWRNISNDFVPRTRNLIAIHSFYETRKIGPVLVRYDTWDALAG
jgi:pimeloyl-ACP methyl ester carboxylesterase